MIDTALRQRLPDSLSSNRLLLRRPQIGDAPALARLANNEKIYRMLARLPHPYKIKDAHAFIDKAARCGQEHAWSVLSRDEDFLGVIGLHFQPLHAPELGYWLGEPYWGEGYASEAAIAVTKACDAIGIQGLQARARADNAASVRVLEKAGFIRTGERMDNCGPHKGVSVVYLEREGRR